MELAAPRRPPFPRGRPISFEMALKRKFKAAINDNRLVILGAQVLSTSSSGGEGLKGASGKRHAMQVRFKGHAVGVRLGKITLHQVRQDARDDRGEKDMIAGPPLGRAPAPAIEPLERCGCAEYVLVRHPGDRLRGLLRRGVAVPADNTGDVFVDACRSHGQEHFGEHPRRTRPHDASLRLHFLR